MIVTDKFVFVHLPRSGGTFVSEVIKKFFPSAYEIGHHLPRELLPEEYSHLPVLGTIRNPWDFYVSLYHYVWLKYAASVLVSWMSENGRLGFNGSLLNLLNLGVEDQRLDVGGVEDDDIARQCFGRTGGEAAENLPLGGGET